jgi:hypothetical protein
VQPGFDFGKELAEEVLGERVVYQRRHDVLWMNMDVITIVAAVHLCQVTKAGKDADAGCAVGEVDGRAAADKL